MRKLLTILFAGALTAVAFQSNPHAGEAGAGPIFRVGTKVVEVDVVARDKKHPVAGLSKEDFTLLDNGQAQQIAFFSMRNIRSATAVPEAGPKAVAAGTFSNRPAADDAATHTVLLLDQLMTSQANQAFAIQRITQYLQQRRKRDGIGIYALGPDLHVVQDLTADDKLLKRAAGQLRSRVPAIRDSDTVGMTEVAAANYTLLYWQERVTAMKNALQATARHLANLPGRKSVVWITEGFPLLYCNPAIGCYDFRPEVEATARSLDDANIALYSVDARGLIGALGQMTGIQNAESGPAPSGPRAIMMQRPAAVGPSHIETMDYLAKLTGGDVYYNSNGLEDSLEKAVEDADVTYSLGFYPVDAAQDGKVHKLSVKVARSGITLRYRQSYYAPVVQVEPERKPTMDKLLKDTLDAAQIGLRVQLEQDAAQAGFVKARVWVDLHDLQLAQQGSRWVGAVDVGFAFDKVTQAVVSTRTIEIPDARLPEMLEQGMTAEQSLPWPEKAVELHIVVEDQATGVAGSLRIVRSKN